MRTALTLGAIGAVWLLIALRQGMKALDRIWARELSEREAWERFHAGDWYTS